jgi:arylacetamide deacetylase
VCEVIQIRKVLFDHFRYRLAPEHRFPSGLEDCLSVSKELFENEMTYQINSNRIILSGDSAGGNLALVVSQKLIHHGYKPYFICLLYPSLQFFDFTLPSYKIYLKRNILGIINENNLLSMISLLSQSDIQINKDILYNSHVSIEDKRKLYPFINPTKYDNESLINHFKYLLSPSMSPLLVSDQQLMQLPTILLFTTEFDIVRDEGKLNISSIN